VGSITALQAVNARHILCIAQHIVEALLRPFWSLSVVLLRSVLSLYFYYFGGTFTILEVEPIGFRASLTMKSKHASMKLHSLEIEMKRYLGNKDMDLLHDFHLRPQFLGLDEDCIRFRD
jgi:hypothetical protein